MSRMTTARVNRWQRDLEKARELVEKVALDVRHAKVTTKGSQYSNVVDLLGSLQPVRHNLAMLTKDDAEFSALPRLLNNIEHRKAQTNAD